uniref:BRCT domain-containing protein n=1 Tax=Esox lucius TaxID=8010 RepID=A0A6Q2Y9Y7_ESOLU
MLELRMVDTKHVFQVSGIKNLYKKGKLLEGIHQLGGKYIGGSGYNDRTTHLIVTHAPMASEKFLAACAGGKWIVNPNYVLDSAKNGSWLPEEPYELDSSWVVPGAVNPVRVWRERVTNGAVAGAFEGWRVLLIVKPTQKDIFQRILTAGKASVHSSCPSSDVAVTHVLTNHVVDYVKAQNACAPCYPTTHIAHHLLGEQVCSLMGWTWTLGETGETQTGGEPVETQTGDFSGIEMEARDYISQIEEARRLREELRSLPETMSYNTPILNSQSSLVSFHNVQNLTECGFFTEALEEILTYLQPGQHPPASFLQPLMQHALHGDAKPLFYNVFHTVLRTILRNNPPRGSPSTERFFLKVLQCPQCEKGVWPYLETSFRLCMGSELTCHSFSSTASPELLRFHGDLQTFAVKLFKCDLRAANNGQAGVVESNLLNHVFWSVWDRSTLGSRPVQQLVELLVEASKWMCSVCEVQAWGAERSRRQRLVLTLQDMLGVVVDVWCQRHSRLNPSLVERSLEDLAQHLAIICQDLPLDVLEALVPGIVSTRLRMAAADSIFRMFCHRGHITLGVEPLSLRRIVSYLAALGKLSAVGPGDHQSDSSSPLSEPEHTSPNLFNPGTITEMPSGLVNGAGPRKKNIPRGVNRVNAAGETVLHRACKRNQVETLLQILALPGIDVNVKGSDLLLQKDHHGRTPLDLVSSATLRQELKQSALMGDTAMEHLGSEVRDLPFLEACSCLLKCLLLTYQLERPQVQDVPLSLGLKLARALKKHSAQRVTAGWADTQSVRLVEDMETVLGVEECLAQLVPAVTECQGAHTRLLIILLEEMKEHRAALLTNTDAL